MKKSGTNAILFVVVGLQLVATNIVAAQEEDSLFSTVDTTAAFETSGDVEKPKRAPRSVREDRLITTNDLLRTLQDGNFEGVISGSRTVTTKRQLESWQFPVMVTLSENEQDVTIVLGLRRISDQQKVSATRLLQLLETNQKSGRTSFAFHRERNRLELFSLIENSGITGQTLRDEINRLAILARDTESLWNLEASAGGASESSPATAYPGATKIVSPSAAPSTSNVVPSTAPVIAASPATAAVSANSLHGRWSASRSASEAFAIMLNADGTFVLVSVSSGKQARSTGKYSLLNNQLTLEGSDGSRLSGTVSLTSDQEFRFEPQATGAASVALTFRKAQ